MAHAISPTRDRMHKPPEVPNWVTGCLFSSISISMSEWGSEVSAALAIQNWTHVLNSHKHIGVLRRSSDLKPTCRSKQSAYGSPLTLCMCFSPVSITSNSVFLIHCNWILGVSAQAHQRREILGNLYVDIGYSQASRRVKPSRQGSQWIVSSGFGAPPSTKPMRSTLNLNHWFMRQFYLLVHWFN